MVVHDEHRDEFARGSGANFPKRRIRGGGEIHENRAKMDLFGSFEEMTLNCAENTKRLASNAIRLAGNAIYFASNAI